MIILCLNSLLFFFKKKIRNTSEWLLIIPPPFENAVYAPGDIELPAAVT